MTARSGKEKIFIPIALGQFHLAGDIRFVVVVEKREKKREPVSDMAW
jgi:hypothetical protein